MIAGIDLGTSAVKVLLLDDNLNVTKARAEYKKSGKQGFIDAVRAAFSELDVKKITAVSLSSQVGTYIVNGKAVIGWNDPIGGEELLELKKSFTNDEFIAEISMPHPSIISYPVPRLMYIGRNFDVSEIRQPKDLIYECLTGTALSDKYSWRGLANLETCVYSKRLLDFAGIDEKVLPPLSEPENGYGRVTKSASNVFGLAEGTRVYLGCNDYFAGLLGMGLTSSGRLFDITGTSEHIGVITEKLDKDTKMVSGPYFFGNVHYGVTASSGISLDFGINNFDLRNVDIKRAFSNPPIFLPYLKGERAPVWDSGARGVFFGISEKTAREDMAYAVLEGVVFSTYHIFESLNVGESFSEMLTAGGAAKDNNFNALKASLFGVPVAALSENDTSAYGACMIAAVGEGLFGDYGEAAKKMCKIKSVTEPLDIPILSERFAIYKELYGKLKQSFKEFRRLDK